MRRARVIAAAGLVVLVAAGSTGAAIHSSSAKLPGGDPQGVALLGRVVHRYLNVPGVSVDVQGLGVTVTKLRAGVVVAEAWTFKGPGGEYVYLARLGKPLYEYMPAKRCWRRQGAGSTAVSFPALGKPFVTYGVRRVEKPVRVAGGWSLRVTPTQPGVSGMTFTISGSYLMRSLTGRLPNGKQLTEHLQTLDAPPRMPVPRPTC